MLLLLSFFVWQAHCYFGDLTVSVNLTSATGAWFKTGATYRPDDPSFPMSCQYWQPPQLMYMSSGDNPLVVGVGKALWDSSKTCGQCLEVMNGNKSIVVVIADYCPPPCTPMQLDLNPKASAKLNLQKNLPVNHANLLARKVPCNWGRDMVLYLDKGSSVYNWYIIPLYISKPLKSLQVLGHDAYHDNYGRWVVAFKTKFPKCNTVVDVKVDKWKIIKHYFKCAYSSTSNELESEWSTYFV